MINTKIYAKIIDVFIKLKYKFLIYAGVAKLADAQDLGSCGAIHAGSSPVTRMKKSPVFSGLLFFDKKSMKKWYVGGSHHCPRAADDSQNTAGNHICRIMH